MPEIAPCSRPSEGIVDQPDSLLRLQLQPQKALCTAALRQEFGGVTLFADKSYGPTPMSILNDDLERMSGETLRMKALELQLSSPAIEAARAGTLSLSREFVEVHRALNLIPEGLAKVMRDLESPLSTAVAQVQRFANESMSTAASAARSALEEVAKLQSLPGREFMQQWAKMEALAASDLTKKLSTDLVGSELMKNLINFEASVGGNYLKQLAALESSLGRDFAAKFLEVDDTIARAAQNLSDSFPLIDERIAEALRGFRDLPARPAERAGIGAATEAADTVDASGSTIGTGTDKGKQSALEAWWATLPFNRKVFLLVLLYFVRTATDECIHEFVKDWTGANGPQERQSIYYNITQDFGADAARHLRCVRASTLKVRSEASTAGTVVDSIPRGTPVEVLETSGSWSLIHYKDGKSANIREGWAASSYLSPDIRKAITQRGNADASLNGG
jgi:hypothetical protein